MMRRLLKLFTHRNVDVLLITVVFVLSAIGLASIYSVDLSRGEMLIYFPVQLVALGLGVLALLGGMLIHKSVYQSTAKIAYMLAVVLLVGVLFFGVTIRGTTGWFRFGGISFQPVEFAKVAVILFLAQWTYRYNRRFITWQYVVSSGAIVGVCVFLVLLQPDLGSALLLFGIWFGLLLVVRIRWQHLVALIGGVLLLAILAWFFLLAPYQKQRVFTFLQPDQDPLGAGYNVTQSIIAIGSGGFFGRGLGFGSQSQLHFLPEAQTDFIFAVIGEELGFVGVSIVCLLYLVLLWRLMRIALICKNDFSAFTVMGIALLFLIQAVVNIGATVGLLPVTGIPLPFISYGGSSLLINFFLIGIAESMHRSVTSRGQLLGA